MDSLDGAGLQETANALSVVSQDVYDFGILITVGSVFIIFMLIFLLTMTSAARRMFDQMYKTFDALVCYLTDPKKANTDLVASNSATNDKIELLSKELPSFIDDCAIFKEQLAKMGNTLHSLEEDIKDLYTKFGSLNQHACPAKTEPGQKAMNDFLHLYTRYPKGWNWLERKLSTVEDGPDVTNGQS